jgi:peptidoglycan hydrolase-like protein with peptidoglycan-binding domain
MWRSVATPKAERYGSPMDARERSEGVVTTVPTVSTSEAVRLAQKAAKVAGALRAQIATANAVLVELDLSPALLA